MTRGLQRAAGALLLIALCGLLWGRQSPDAVIFPTASPTRLAVAEFTPRAAGTAETQTALSVFNKVLFDDLKFSAFFEVPSQSFYPLRPMRVPEDVVFEDWRVPTLEVDFLVFGNLQVDVGRTVVEAYLYDVKTGEQVLGKRFTVSDSTLIRRAAHQFADEVVRQLSAGASRGIGSTRISVATLKGDSKEIQIMDYDGANVRTVTANGGINKFPAWSPDNKRLAFVTKLPAVARWELWLQGLEGGLSKISFDSSFVSSPAFSPDGARIAFGARAADKQAADIFVSDLSGRAIRNLTNHRAIDTSPTWSPTGGQIAFISDRSGTPQVWVMDADGSNLQRLVTEGGHCDSPAWSPDGRFILYSWQAPRQWKHDIYVVEAASRNIRQLTSGFGSNESPTWSPDGRHIAFQSTRTGSKQIFIMNLDGKNLRQITAYGINEGPAWSHYEE